MKQTTLEAPGISGDRLENSIFGILDKIQLLSMATLGVDMQPYINTCFFAYDLTLRLYILTPPSTQHSQNITQNHRVAVSVFDTHQISGAELQGLQMFGTCHQAAGDELASALQIYSDRFPGLKTSAPDIPTLLKDFQSRFFVITVESIKTFDEIAFGKEVWIIANVNRA